MADNWDFYFTKIDDKIGSIFVDLDLQSRAPVATHRTAVYLRLFMRKPRADGLSSQEEFETLSEIEDALESVIAETGAIYAGRATTNGLRDYVFCARYPDRLVDEARNALAKFADYKFEIGSRLDHDWKTYLGYLYPSARDSERMKNRKVCDALEAAGDDLASEREIDHWIYFARAADRVAFVSKVEPLGYALRSTSDPTPGAPTNKFGAQIYRSDLPNKDQMNEVTLALLAIAEEFDGAYDGWECPVVK